MRDTAYISYIDTVNMFIHKIRTMYAKQKHPVRYSNGK